MDITIFLAQIWGPLLIAVGFGFFFAKSFYAEVYRDLEKSSFAVLFFGMVALAVGIVQIKFHNTWSTLPEALISFLGWGLLLKGFLCTAFPHMVDRWGDRVYKSALIPVAGWVTLVFGLYLTWFGYVML